MHHRPGFKGHAPALQAGWGPGQREGGGEGGRNEKEKKRQGERRETAQRQMSSCSGQARLTGAGRDVLFFVFQPVR